MKAAKKNKQTAEFGDFQTPIELARLACRIIAEQKVKPVSIVEPTCGTGNFIVAALEQFSEIQNVTGLDINPDYVQAAISAVHSRPHTGEVRIKCDSFFDVDWPKLLQGLPDPLLVIGNPPWVTNAELGTIGSWNLPLKTNFQNRVGLDAVTGNSNFDISEWMLLRMLECLNGREATMGMLCKTTVARKVLAYAWKNQIGLKRSEMYLIDAKQHFGASVDACFLVFHTSTSGFNSECLVYTSISEKKPAHTIGYRDCQLIADVPLYERWKHLQGEEPAFKWRSGVKHDCAKVMEFRKENGRYHNGLGELVELEDEYVFPMLKSSDIAKGWVSWPRRWMLVTQKTVSSDTSYIMHRAPKTWNYLNGHSTFLDRRASSIYKNRSRFSIFGVGPYSFAPWKVAISGFYKRLVFNLVGRFEEKPIMLDDTSYFIPCNSRQEAECLVSLLNSNIAKEFFQSFIFWDAKRPITIGLLRRLNFSAIAHELETEEIMAQYLFRRGSLMGRLQR